MKRIIYIADPEILAVPIKECNEPLVDIKNFDELLYGPPEYDIAIDCYTRLRKTVFEKLCRAQNDLPKGWHFRLFEGFRSLTVQQILFDKIYQIVSSRSPDASHAKRFYETTGLVSPVINLDGTQNIPPHNTGAAVDLEIISDDNQLIDMGMTAKEWWSVPPELCLTNSPLVNDTVKLNRKILLDVLQNHGFVNYPTEWWHYSYGDRYWAYHQPEKSAIYGSVEAISNYTSNE
jgi:D-alanyl-D-alanine dipeptidase